MPSEMKAFTRTRIVDLVCTPDDLEKLAIKARNRLNELKIGDDTLVEYIHGTKITIAVRLDQDRI